MTAIPLPTYLQVEPVGQCNLRCQVCAIQFRDDGPPTGPPAFMPYERFTRLVDGFGGLQELHLQGLGEPTMHPRFFDMVAYAVGKGIRVSTNSNLTLLNVGRAERLIDSGLHLLHISIDGSTAETYERIRVRARYSRIVRNLDGLVALRARRGTAHPRLHLTMVVMRQNLHELPAVVRQAHQWSIDELFVQHLCHDFGESSLPAKYRPMRAFVEEQTLRGEDPARVEHYFSQARAVAADLGVVLRLPRATPRPYPPGTPGRTRCSWPWTGAYVSYQGYAMPCCMVSTPDRTNFGNMDDQGVAETWNAPDFQAFREQLASDTPPEICRSCALYQGTF